MKTIKQVTFDSDVIQDYRFMLTISKIFKDNVNRTIRKVSEYNSNPCLEKSERLLQKNLGKNTSLISKYFHGKITSSNKYLCNDSLILKKINNVSFGLCNGILYDSSEKGVFEFLWGDTGEFNKMCDDLFLRLVSDVYILYMSTPQNMKNSDNYKLYTKIIESFCDDAVFSKYFTFYQICRDYNISSFKYFAIREETIQPLSLYIMLMNAAQKKYNCRSKNNHDIMLKDVFRNEFKWFVKNNLSSNYKNIDNKINSIFIKEFMQLLKKFEPKNSSNAFKIRWLIQKDMVKSINLIDHNEDNKDAAQIRRDIYTTSKYLASIEEGIYSEVQTHYDLILADILYRKNPLIVNL